jgi:Flp pilus assembly protein TadD
VFLSSYTRTLRIDTNKIRQVGTELGLLYPGAMNETTRNIVIGVIVVVIIALLGYLAWQEGQTTPSTSSTATTTVSTSTGTSINLSTLTSATTTGGYTITPVTGSAPTAPNYKTPLTFAAGTNAAEESQDQTDFANAQTTLASNPKDYTSWLELGILREATGDYTGAIADWKYVTELYPNDPTAFANLGNLYANDLQEPAQGIVYYKDAIKLDPTKEETFYENLAQIYINEGDTADAKATLEQGISAQVSGYQNLQNELNSMQ